jgi:hypothetical protein
MSHVHQFEFIVAWRGRRHPPFGPRLPPLNQQYSSVEMASSPGLQPIASMRK